MPIVYLIEAFLIYLVCNCSWKYIIKPALDNRSGNVETETKIERKIRKANQKKYEKDLIDKLKK